MARQMGQAEIPKLWSLTAVNAYESALNKVFCTMCNDTRPLIVQKVGLRARKTNNIVERLHGTLKGRK
jgi:hypothetical protein